MKKKKAVGINEKHDRLAAKVAGMRPIDIENHETSLQFLKTVRETCEKEKNLPELLAYLKKARNRRLRLLSAKVPSKDFIATDRNFEIWGYAFDYVFKEISEKLTEVEERIKAGKYLPAAFQRAMVKDTTQPTDRGLSVEQKVLLIHFLGDIDYSTHKSSEISETGFFKVLALLLNRSAENIKKAYNNRNRNSGLNPFTQDNLTAVIQIFKEVKAPYLAEKAEKELQKLLQKQNVNKNS